MAKSGRHKKLCKQEKAKTQLKGKKTLAKAQNVVEPKLRAKKILIREQLKPVSSTAPSAQHDSDDDVQNEEVAVEAEATTRKKQSLQDVLTSLNHHNKNIKKDALNGLLEIVTSQSVLLGANLDRILEKLGALTSDLEGVVRKENLRVSEIIFAQVKEEQVQPFWSLLLTHVKCTLTNLSPSIRYECLSFLALLISYFPNLTASSKHVILPNLLSLVSTSGSTLASSSGSGSSKSTPASNKSKLKVDISSQHNDSNERLRVLSLIALCLDLEKKSVRESSSAGSILHVNWDTYNPNSLPFPLGYQEFQNDGQHLKFSFNDASLSGASTSFEDVSSNFWPNFVQSCLPVLWETWLEFRPSLKEESADRSRSIKIESGGRGNSSLSSLAVEYLKCIVTVMSRLVLLRQGASEQTGADEGRNELIRALRKNHGQSLKKYFLNGLPYFATQESQRKELTTVNLDLYHIASELRLVDNKLMKTLENYVRGLMGKSFLDAGQTAKVLDIMTLIRMERTGGVISEVIDYALASEFHETVNSFLLQALAVTRTNLGTENNFVLRAVDWNNVVNQLLVESSSLNSKAVQILTLIGLRRLCDFSMYAEENFDKFQDFLKEAGDEDEDGDSLAAWDLVVRLFHVLNRVDSIEKRRTGLSEPIQSVISQLRASTVAAAV